MSNFTTKAFCLLAFCYLFIGFDAIGQQANISDTYRSAANPLYWKNKKPHAAYWQQDVAYAIDANIVEQRNIIEATEQLQYWNNSPDTLSVVYFHLYQNAFIKGSYLEKLHKDNKQPVTNLGTYSKEGLGTTVRNIKVDGKSAKSELDNTILKIYLPKALLPGASVVFRMDFTTYFDRNDFRRRMAMYPSWGFMHYNGVHWYPRVCVYDIKKGWDTDQHLNKELYGDYGTFDVKLTFAANYVVEATGALQNPKEVYPGDLRERLDIKNFANKPWNEKPGIITPYDPSVRKTWHYQATNVHDFAFTADPHYRIGETSWNGISCVAIVTEPHASKWQTAADYIAKVVRTFSEDFGMYEYPKMVAADANDGMEYPMLTLCGGAEPDFHGLFAHEIGHNWFYGMIGNNETYRAALDEGFTQFITSWALEKLDGPYLTGSPEKSRYKRSHRIPTLARDARVYNRYLSDAVRGEDKPLNTHSNDFNGALGHENGYSNVYYKTATMLYNLQYVLGDELFLNAMKHYVAQWKMAHPYFEDFRQSIISYTHQDLNWFFDQWMETTKRLDYGVKSVRKTHIRDQYKITFKRQEEMQMPVDFRITSRDLTEYNYTIPNTYFSKQKNSTVLPKWYGWGMFNRTYTTKVIIPSGIDVVQIDPTNRLGDMNMLNNSKVPGCAMPRETYSFRFDNLLNQPFDWKRYNAYWRPDVWWNSIDGLKLGLHLDGSYMNVLRKFHGTVWFNTRALSLLKYRAFEGENWWKNVSPVDYTMRYETPLTKINRRINWGIESRFMDGFARHSTNVSYQLTGKDRFTIEATTLYRSGDITNAYLFYPQEWSSYSNGSLYRGVKNSYLQMQFQHLFASQIGQGVMRYTLRAPLNYQYAFLQAEHINKKAIGKFDIHSRGFLRVGIGNDIPYESALFLQGANPEEMMESKFTRSQGVVPLDLGGMSTNSFSNLHAGGGLNLRGYTGYYAIDENGGTLYTNYKGRSGASVNVEVEFDRLIRFKPKKLHDVLHIDTYFFGDAGVISRGLLDINNIPALNPVREWSKIRMDAGLGAAFTIKRFGPFEKVQPFTVRIDCPFFISAPPAAQPNEFDVRWVIGFSRAF